MKKILRHTLSFIFGVLSITCFNYQIDRENDTLVQWVRSNTSVIETLNIQAQDHDLKPLANIIGDATVVCLGESRHDIHEQFLLKHRFIRYMVEELGFTTFILEASLPYSELINKYLQYGQGSIEEILANMPGWFLWDTQEISDLLKWMRNYNISAPDQNKLHFYGIDIVAPNYAVSSILSYLKRVDLNMSAKFQYQNFGQDIFEDNNWSVSMQRYTELSVEEKALLNINFENLHRHLVQNEEKYISASTIEEYNWILRLAYTAEQAIRMFSADSRLEMGLIRDSAMAKNTLWIKENQSNGQKAIIWAHNVHITKGEFKMTGESASIKGMGYMLGEALGNEMVSIGASFNRGEFQAQNRVFPYANENTIDGVLAKSGLKYGLLDFRAKGYNDFAIKWLSNERVIAGQEFEMTIVPANSFDAIFFVDEISRTRPNPVSRQRLHNMN